MPAAVQPNLGLTAGWNDGDAYGAAMNANLRTLDRVVQLAVKSAKTTAQPGSPIAGDQYIVPTGATGGWSSQVGKLASFDGTSWTYTTAKEGWQAWTIDEKQTYAYKGTLWHRASEFINVKEYGAVGDGTADDTAAIQAAIDWATTIGAICFFPPGQYKITSSLTLAHGARLVGTSSFWTQTASIVRGATQTINLISFPTTADVTDGNGTKTYLGILIRDLWFVGGLNQINAPNGGVNCVIDNVTFESCDNAAINCAGFCEGWQIDLCEIAGSEEQGGPRVGNYGISLSGNGSGGYFPAWVRCCVTRCLIRFHAVAGVRIAGSSVWSSKFSDLKFSEIAGIAIHLDGACRDCVLDTIDTAFVGWIQDTTQTGSINNGSTTLTLSADHNFPNGARIKVAGAGPAGGPLWAYISSGGGTTTLTLSVAASTTVSGAAVTVIGATRYATTTGSITSGTATLTVASGTGYLNGMDICVAGAGSNGADLQTTISSGGGTTTLTLAANAGTTVSGAEVTLYTASVVKIGTTGGTPSNLIFENCNFKETAPLSGLRYSVDLASFNSGHCTWIGGSTESRPIYDPNGRCMGITSDKTIFRKPNWVLTTGSPQFVGITMPGDLRMNGKIFNAQGRSLTPVLLGTAFINLALGSGTQTIFTSPSGSVTRVLFLVLRDPNTWGGAGTTYNFTGWRQGVALPALAANTGYCIIDTTDITAFTELAASTAFQITPVGGTSTGTVLIDAYGVMA